jgi:histidinol-phosphatase (PHP family)
MLFDYHIHTEHSWDASGSMIDYCKRALDLGLEEIGFSDHIDLDPIDRAFGYHNFQKIDSSIRDIRDIFGKRIKIKKGIEITYQEEFHDQISEFVNKWEYDYTLAGIHLSKGIFYTGREAEMQFREFSDPLSAFQFYFDEMLNSINSGLINIVAHIDVFYRHGRVVFGDIDPNVLKPALKQIFKSMIERGISLEINTGDISNERGWDIYPSDWILEEYRNSGGSAITFGSDSHAPKALAGGFEKALRKAQKFGFKGWTLFEKRKPVFVPFN